MNKRLFKQFRQLLDRCDDVCHNFVSQHRKIANLVNKSGETALIFACCHGFEQTVRELTKYCNVNHVDYYPGRTALSYAAEHGFDNIVQHLINQKAELNARDMYGFTALIYACLKNKDDTAITLVHAGAMYRETCVDTTDKLRATHADKDAAIYIKSIYTRRIIAVVNDVDDNILAQCFKTTYVPGVIDMIADFII